MKIPEKSPSLNGLASHEYEEIVQLSHSKEIKDFLAKVNNEYIYWDKFKHRPMPRGLDPQKAWFLLKIIRNFQAKEIPVKDKNGRKFKFWLPEKVQEYLHTVDTFLGGSVASSKPNLGIDAQEKYLIGSLVEEAISSSLLEGAVTTREDAKEMILRGKRPDSHAQKMVYNNYLSIKKLSALKDRDLSLDLIFDIHKTITSETLKDPEFSGRFRVKEDREIFVMDSYGNVLYTPPPPGEVESRMIELINFANEDRLDDGFIHPVVKAVLLHFILAYIHPFIDGNGRVARALFYWYMLKKGFWLVEYLSISRIFLKTPAKYSRSYLYSEIDEGDLTYFLQYNLSSLNSAIDDLKTFIDVKQEEIKEVTKNINKHPDLNFRQISLLEHALRHPGYLYSIQKHKNYHGVTYQTARMDLLKLAEKNMADQLKRGRAFYFVVKEEIRRQLAD